MPIQQQIVRTAAKWAYPLLLGQQVRARARTLTVEYEGLTPPGQRRGLHGNRLEFAFREWVLTKVGSGRWLAQLEEHHADNVKVVGSTPTPFGRAERGFAGSNPVPLERPGRSRFRRCAGLRMRITKKYRNVCSRTARKGVLKSADTAVRTWCRGPQRKRRSDWSAARCGAAHRSRSAQATFHTGGVARTGRFLPGLISGE